MAGSVVDRVISTCRAEDVEAGLASLWREVSSRTPAARPIMSNLVVFQACASASGVDATAAIPGVPIEAVAERHPSRIIVLMHKNDPDRLQAPVTASAAILLFGRDPARSAVEQITIHCVSAEASLPSIVRRLVLGDRPTSVWWTEDFSQAPPLTALATIGRQFVYDSGQWRDVPAGMRAVLALLQEAHAPDVADVNWRRLAPMRRALDASVASIAARPENRHLAMRIRHGRQDESQAWLVTGWLLTQLARDQRQVEVEREATDDRGLSIALTDDDAPVCTADLSEEHIVVTESGDAAPLIAHVPAEHVAAAVVAELSSLGRDPSLVAAIRAAYERFS